MHPGRGYFLHFLLISLDIFSGTFFFFGGFRERDRERKRELSLQPCKRMKS